MKKKKPCGCGGRSIQSGFVGGSVNSVCHGFTGGVTSHQSHVVPNPKIVFICWDQYFTNTPAAVTSLTQFGNDLAQGGYWSGLSQYGVGAASLQGHVVIDMKAYPTPNSQNSGQAFSESQMQSQLSTWLNNGVVTPKPAGNEEDLVYLILAPSDTTLSLNGQTGGFCGYHQHGKYNATTARDNLIWGTVQGYNKSSSGTVFVNSISFCISHELSEAFSNPDGQGWYNDNGCEIGDICEANANGPCCITVPYKGWQVENYWSNVDGSCIIGPTGARWFLVHNEVKMQRGATVTALWRSNDTHLDLFATGNDGAVWSTWWESAHGWQPWFLVHNEVKMQPGATVTALWRSNDTHLDLFATGNDGAVWSTWWESAHGWQPWFAIYDSYWNNVKMQPGATVTALWRSNDTHLDLFATGNDGAVWSIWWEAGPGW